MTESTADWIFEAFSEDYPEDIRHVATVICCGHLVTRGGYPYDSDIDDEEMIVAELDPCKEYQRTMIVRYDLDKLRARERRALQDYEDGKMDLLGCVYESE